MYAHDVSMRVYPESGVTSGNHPTSHHGGRPATVEAWAKINRYHVQCLTPFLAKLKATPDGDGSLLDHTVYLYGSGMGNPDVHDHVNLPVLVAGGAGKLKGGRHIKYAEPTPLANLHLTLLNKAGVPVETFADSQKKIAELLDPVSL